MNDLSEIRETFWFKITITCKLINHTFKVIDQKWNKMIMNLTTDLCNFLQYYP